MLGAFLNDKLTKDRPFEKRDRKMLRFVGLVYGFAIWYVLINPAMGKLADYEINVKSIETTSFKHLSEGSDMDVIVYGYNQQDGVRIVPREERVNLKRIDSINVVPDIEFFQGDTIVNTSRLVQVTEKSTSELYFLGSRDKTQYLRLTLSDYRALPPVFRKYKKEYFHFKADTIKPANDTLKNAPL